MRTGVLPTAVAALLCGLLVAAMTGSAHSWAGEAVLLALVGVVLIAIVARLRRRSAGQRMYERPQTDSHRDAETSDESVSARIMEIVRPFDLEWARNETFTSPWRGSHIVPFRELLASRAILDLREDTGRNVTLQELMEAVATFVALYDATTHPEPLLRAGGWQEVMPAGTSDETEAFVVRRRNLRREAFAVALAFEQIATSG